MSGLVKKPNLDRTKTIQGWMRPQELVWLAKAAGGLERIIEVGSYRGRSTRAMLDNSEAHIWCVDSWATALGTTADYEAFLKNIKDKKEQVTVLRMLSTEGAAELLRTLGAHSFDLVFIDACHSYECVRTDILAYIPLVRIGGILSGHDYDRRGVKKAVNELVGEFELTKSIWWARK